MLPQDRVQLRKAFRVEGAAIRQLCVLPHAGLGGDLGRRGQVERAPHLGE